MNQNTEGKDSAESVKRYDLKTDVLTGAPYFDDMPDGHWVKYEDYQRTESELTRLREELLHKSLAVKSLETINDEMRAEAKP